MAYNVFISYSSKNMKVVDWARTSLAQPGLTDVFAAEYSIKPGQVLNAEIIRAIRSCDLFVLLWGRDARASDYVSQEIGIAIGCNKTILPVVMEKRVPVPAFISNLKHLDAHKDWEGSFKQLKQIVDANAANLQNVKAIATIGAMIVAFIILSNSKKS